jgi:hypothetical protein
MHRFIQRARDEQGHERGFFMVWFAITFVAIMGFAALAIEYNRRGNIATRVQKAADAAALAGAVFMPENIGNKAYTTAKTIASENGFTDGANGVVITTAAGKLPNQLKVTISVPTKNPFGGIVGYKNSTIVRSAVAEYQLPQNLGSPQNTYGNDPESTATPPQFWGNIFGRSSNKSKGDAIQAAGPGAATSLCDADNCPSSVNKDYDANGYFYGIDVPPGTSGALNVQVYDPAFVHVGDNCGIDASGNVNDTDAKNSLTNAATLSAASIPGYPAGDAPSARYAAGTTNKYCNGDNYYADGSNTALPWTVFKLRSPDSSSWDPTNNPVVCQAEFPGVYPERTSNLPTGGSVDANNLKNLLQSTTNFPGTVPAMRFEDFFRRWVQICSIANPEVGTYFLQVETATKIDGTATPLGGGSNRYAIKIGLGSNFATSNGIRIYGNQKMGIYANAVGADTRFYLTRILPGNAGHTLVLQFFDVGDASQPGTISVLPPPDSNVAGGQFSGCQYTAPPGNSTGPPWGTLVDTNANCTISVNNASFNGQWVTFDVRIPSDYTCNDSDPLGCWTRLRFTYPSTTNVSDTTTWQAYMLGEPVRLIQ